MSTPPRRRRTESRRSPSDGGGWLPTAAMGLGVIVAGLGIGALVAVLMQRNSGTVAPVAIVTSTPPVVTATRGPIAIATIRPPHTPRPSASAAPSPAPSGSPSATAQPAPSPTDKPSASPVPTDRVATPPPATPPPATPKAIVAVTPAPAPSATPQAAATPAGTSASAAAPVASAGAGAMSAYDEHASAVVRRYIEALIRGDEKTAYTALGAGSEATSGSLTERAFLDASARIVSLKVTRIDASNATVGCEMASAKGHFYGTYRVTAGTGGPYIAEHDYIKV